MPQRTLTEFLIELSQKQSMRNEYRDNNRRNGLLRRFELEGNPALQPGATLDQMKQAVAQDAQGGETKIEWWILVNQAPVPNDQYQPT